MLTVVKNIVIIVVMEKVPQPTKSENCSTINELHEAYTYNL